MASRIPVAAALAAAALGVTTAYAEPTGLDEIVVTAQRKQESAQTIGLALSVLSGDSLRDKGVEKVNDLQNATPSLEIEPAFGNSVIHAVVLDQIAPDASVGLVPKH